MTPSRRSSTWRSRGWTLAARLILRDPDLARDAVQEALIRAWRYLPGLRDPDTFDGGFTASSSTPVSTWHGIASGA